MSLRTPTNPETALFAALKMGGRADKPKAKARIDKLLDPLKGKKEFVTLADKLGLKGYDETLIDYIEAEPGTSEAVTAARTIVRNQNWPFLWETLIDTKDVERARHLARALGRTNDGASVNVLKDVLLKHKGATVGYRRDLVDALVSSRRGGDQILKLAAAKELPDELRETAALALARSPDRHLRDRGAEQLPPPKAPGSDKPLAELMKVKGNPKNGPAAFAKGTCATCHRAKGVENTIDFGPDLSGIGSKLSREAMYQSILHPSAAISHGFHGVQVELKNGKGTLVGYLTGETDDALQLRLPGGVDRSVEKTEVGKQTEMEASLMPAGLGAILTPQELADLCAWLGNLR